MKLNSIDNTRLIFKNNHNAENNKSYANSQRNNVAFGSAADIMLATMDGIERGGFAASFVAQDFWAWQLPVQLKVYQETAMQQAKRTQPTQQVLQSERY